MGESGKVEKENVGNRLALTKIIDLTHLEKYHFLAKASKCIFNKARSKPRVIEEVLVGFSQKSS